MTFKWYIFFKDFNLNFFRFIIFLNIQIIKINYRFLKEFLYVFFKKVSKIINKYA